MLDAWFFFLEVVIPLKNFLGISNLLILKEKKKSLTVKNKLYSIKTNYFITLKDSLNMHAM